MIDLTALQDDPAATVLTLSLLALLASLIMISRPQTLLNDLASRVIHRLLILRYPIHHTETRNPIPTAPFRWPNGQGDVAKFLHGKENSLLWQEKYGKIYRIWSGTTPEIVLTTPKQVKAVFQDSDQHSKAVNNNSGYLLSQLLGNCVGLISREDWKRVRSVTETAFHRQASTKYVDLVVMQVKHHLDEYEKSASFAAGCIDPAKDLKMIPFWIVAEILYGKLEPAMEEELRQLVPIRERLFQTALAGGVYRYAWSKYLPTQTNKLLAIFKSRWEAFNDMAKTTASDRGAPHAPIVSYYEAVDQRVCSRSEILQTIDEMLFANLDVTLGGLTWPLVQLAANEKVQERLRTEVEQELVQAKDTVPATYLTSSSSYLQSTISESSRLRPLAAFSVPQSAPSARILDGYMIPAGSNFIVDSHSLNERNPYWGDDGTVFRPERFLESKVTDARYNIWRYGFGPRQCLGKYVADLIIRALVMELVQRYSLSLIDAKGEWKRDAEVWIDHPDMKLGCVARHTNKLSNKEVKPSAPIWKPGNEISGFQLNETEISERLTPPGRRILEEYAGINPSEVVQHIVSIQQQAYAVCPPSYRPFIGYIRFLAFPLLDHPSYAEVLAMLTPRAEAAPRTLLDLGCCFGQDMRQLALDGADLSASLGVDIEPSFIALGHQLFRDSEAKMHFEVADVFHDKVALWQRLAGKVDVVHASNFFHTFDWNRQLAAAMQIGSLLRKGEVKPLVVGCCIGSVNPREVAIVSKDKMSFCHDAVSFGKLWDQVGRQLDARFEVDAHLNTLESTMQVGPLAETSMRMMVFKVSVHP